MITVCSCRDIGLSANSFAAVGSSLRETCGAADHWPAKFQAATKDNPIRQGRSAEKPKSVKKMMQPLAKDEETDAEVTWEDQNNINTFSKLHNKLIDLQDLLAEKNVRPVHLSALKAL